MSCDEKLGTEKALALATTNLEKLLGVELTAETGDLVASRGGRLLNSMEAKIVAVISPSRGIVDLFQDI